MAFKIKGLCSAPYTPFRNDSERSVDLEAIQYHAAELKAQGVLYAFVCGTTGESLSLTVPERKAILEHWLKAGKDHGVTVISHVGCESINDTLELAKHAEAVGAAAVAVMPPTFSKPSSLDVIITLLETVSKAAPKTPLYWYHIPSRTGTTISPYSVLKKLHEIITESKGERLGNFRGLKFSDSNLHTYANCAHFADGHYNICLGMDEHLLGALAMCGVERTAAIGSTYNYQGKLYNKMIEAFAKGDKEEAMRLQRKTHASVDLLLTPDAFSCGVPGVNVGKALMELRMGGKNVGPPRYPGSAMPEEGKAKLKAAADAVGCFDDE
jgi:N-acetylneuraminate lyase